MFTACSLIFFIISVFADKIDDADRVVASGNFQYALQLYREAIAEISNVKDIAYAYSAIGSTYLEMNLPQLAGDAFVTAGNTHCKPEYYFNAGMSYASAGAPPHVVMETYESCLKCKGNIRPCVLKIASIHQNNDNFVLTQEYLLKCIRLAPQNPDAYIYLGDVYNNRKFFGEALIKYKEALEILIPQTSYRHTDAHSKIKIPSFSSLPPPPPHIKSLLLNVLVSLGDVYYNMKQPSNAYTCYYNAKELVEISTKLSEQMLMHKYIEATAGAYFISQEISRWHKYEYEQYNLVRLISNYLSNAVSMHAKGSDAVRPPISPYRFLFLDGNTIPSEKSNESSALNVGKLFSDISRESATGIVQSNLGRGRNLFPHVATNNLDGVASRTVMNSLKPIKIGYISRRFNDYPGTQMMLRIFGSHNRTNVHVTALANGPDSSAAWNRNESAYRSVIRETSDVFIDLSEMNHSMALQSLIELELDVLIDYDGIHDFNNLRLLSAYKQLLQEHLQSDLVLEKGNAQFDVEMDGGEGSDANGVETEKRHRCSVVSWLGFAGPVGAVKHDFRLKSLLPDYMLVDRRIIPPESVGSNYLEKMVFVPTTYQPQDEYSDDLTLPTMDTLESNATYGVEGRRDVDFPLATTRIHDWDLLSTQSASSNDMSMPTHKQLRYHLLSKYNSVSDEALEDVSSGRWYVCFNRLEKVTPDVFEDWMWMLKGRKSTNKKALSTYLVLLSGDAEISKRILESAAYHGIPKTRILFFPRLSKLDYNIVLAISDLFLDTRFYGSHTVASDAIYRYTPVLTLVGNTFASRVSYSLNNALDYSVDDSEDSDSRMKYYHFSNIGSSLLSVDNRKQYVDTGIRLTDTIADTPGVNPDVTVAGGVSYADILRKYIKTSITGNHSSMSTNVLFNSRAFAKNLNALYSSVVEVQRMERDAHIFLESSI